MSQLFLVHPRDQATLLVILGSVALACSLFAGSEKRQEVKPYRLDVNSAGVAELRSLPEIGARRAEKIYRERRARGAYRTLDELAQAAGIGPHVVAQLVSYVRIGNLKR
jgi:DNA uptake protein ComE-like DNA-binding protein